MNFDPRLALPVAGAILGPLLALLLWRRLGSKARNPFICSAFGLLAIGYSLCVWTFLIEPRTLVVRRLTVESAAWSGPPLRIGVLSDTHVGAPHVDAERVRSTVARLSRERPDIIVYLGDYAGGHEPARVRAVPDRSAVLTGIAMLGEADAPLGLFAVLGNHDWWYDGRATEAALRRAGVTVLENAGIRVERPGGAFWLAGLADLESRRAEPDVAAALADAAPGEPGLVLSHPPDSFTEVPPRVALTLAGHSHCGQVNLPFLGRIVHASQGSKRWGCGLYDEAGRKLFVTAGLGVSILPVRFRAPPEIAVVTLKSPDPSPERLEP